MSETGKFIVLVSSGGREGGQGLQPISFALCTCNHTCCINKMKTPNKLFCPLTELLSLSFTGA